MFDGKLRQTGRLELQPGRIEFDTATILGFPSLRRTIGHCWMSVVWQQLALLVGNGLRQCFQRKDSVPARLANPGRTDPARASRGADRVRIELLLRLVSCSGSNLPMSFASHTTAKATAAKTAPCAKQSETSESARAMRKSRAPFLDRFCARWCKVFPERDTTWAETVARDCRPLRGRSLTADYAGAFAFRPAAGGGTQPDMRHSTPSIRLPCSKRVRLQVMMAPVAASSARRFRTFAIGTPVSLASSESSR